MLTTLSICEQAYRATAEEQDDTIIWLTHMLRKAEVDTGLLLRGGAVNYANKAQQAPPLVFGEWEQRHPAHLARDLERFMAEGGRVYVSDEDLARYALAADELIDGVQVVDWKGVVGLIAEHDVVMNW